MKFTGGETTSGVRIVLVDDEPSFGQLIAQALAEVGHECHYFVSGPDALEYLTSKPVDLLITDVHMPGQNGIELLRRTRTLSSMIPVIIITGYPSVATAVDALRLGVVDYIAKPFRPDELLDAVERALEKSLTLRKITATRDALSEWDTWLSTMERALAANDSFQETSAGIAPRPKLMFEGLSQSEFETLSLREREVGNKLAGGLRTKEIAQALHISPHTVRNHLKAIYRKLGVHSQVALVSKLRG